MHGKTTTECAETTEEAEPADQAYHQASGAIQHPVDPKVLLLELRGWLLRAETGSFTGRSAVSAFSVVSSIQLQFGWCSSIQSVACASGSRPAGWLATPILDSAQKLLDFVK
jgi:hypothetical protein